MHDVRKVIEVERALKDHSIYDADLETLHRYLQYVSSATGPSEYNIKMDRLNETIRMLIVQKENKIQNIENAEGLKRSNRWSKVAGISAALSVIVGILFGTVSIIQNSISHQSPTQNYQKQTQLQQPITNVVQSSSSSQSP